MQHIRRIALPIGLVVTVILLFAVSGSSQSRSKPRSKRPNTAKAKSTNTLSRKEAAELIAKSLGLPAIVPILLAKRYFKDSSGDRSGPFGIEQVCLIVGNKYSDKRDMLNELQAKDLIRIGENRQREGKCDYLWATVELTYEGKRYLVKETDVNYQVKVYDLTFGEITGIQIFEQSKAALADYTLKKTNITPFASKLSTEPISRQATFALYDDGWRIKR